MLLQAVPNPAAAQKSTGNIAAGYEAARRVVMEGKLPEKYKSAAGKITRIMIALPIALVMSWALYQRSVYSMRREWKILARVNIWNWVHYADSRTVVLGTERKSLTRVSATAEDIVAG
ncbi:hypothetical protein LTR28_000377 [Elasticomyces elasticus]|nr:hypothetical protein LTR28_000377 [Elasticomyces elasticus]